MTTYTTITSPIDPLTLVARDGRLIGIYCQQHKGKPEIAEDWKEDPEPFAEPIRQLQEYFQGSRREFDLPLAPDGTEFQQQVWAELRRIPFGETISYGELARRINNPKAVRAVGLANGRNPISIVIPCHRVIGANGKLTGYGGGLERKKRLLELETKSV